MRLEYGEINPLAPAELSRFGFIVGTWRCEARLKRDESHWETLRASWVGRYVLDGWAIADEYRMSTASGELLVLGLNVRAYDGEKKVWNMKWLNGFSGAWTDLGPEELGGVTADEKSITLIMKEPVAGHGFTRATYTNFSENHFTWRGERSCDRKTWEEFLVVECYRIQDSLEHSDS